jgi:dCMP deaminase
LELFGQYLTKLAHMRPGWDEYFMGIARTVASRATCPRASVGAVVVRDHRILTTGYNGSARHAGHCLDVGCEMLNGHCVRTVHAEANAIVQGALHGVGLAGSTIYCTHQPCLHCSKLLISAGILRVTYEQAYPDGLAEKLLAEAGVESTLYPPPGQSRILRTA